MIRETEGSVRKNPVIGNSEFKPFLQILREENSRVTNGMTPYRIVSMFT